jgi:dienelactone hydrolase
LKFLRTLLLGSAALAVSVASATIRTQVVEYRQGDTVLQGYLAYDDAVRTPRPGVLVVHDWNGLDEYEMRRARELAGLGYVAFAADIYGKGVRPKTTQESGAQAGKYRQDVALFRARLNASLDALATHPRVNRTKLGAIGYCFGGGGVLELARSGAPVGGVVSFHGSLGTPRSEDATNIKGKVLSIQGADDPAIPKEALLGFIKEMREAKVDYQIELYNLAVHAFTVPGPSYDEKSDRRSWESMRDFFREVFGA